MISPSLFLRIALACLCLPLAAQDVPGWELVWADEFDLADGSAPDPANWGYDTGGGGWGNQELQYYTSRRENSRIEGGQLVIEAREESFGGRNYTSARLLTRDKWSFTHGRFEARLKVASGEGLWPAFWMLGSDIGSVGWPQCGEIDIMEYVGREPLELFGTIHGPGYSGGGSFGGTHHFATNMADDFHVVAVEWDPGEIRWFVDGILYHTATPEDVAPSPWVFEKPHFLLLNLAVGGNFGGPVGAATSFPKQYLIDYVRVYERAAPDAENVLLNPGFESGSLTGWTGYSPGGANEAGGYVETPADRYYNGGNPGGDPVRTRTGGHVGKTFGDFSGAENYNGFYQDITTSAGETWNARGWMLSHPQDLLSGGNRAWIELAFLDSADAVLALHRSPAIDSAGLLPDTWMPVVVSEEYDPFTYQVVGNSSSLTAPTGTVKARFQVVFQQPLYDAGSIYLDDLSLSREGGALPLPAHTGSGHVVSWMPTNAEASYQVQRSEDQLVWLDLGPPVAGSGMASAFSPEGGFFRVVEDEPVGESVLPATAVPGFFIAWESVPGRTYQVEHSLDLESFTPFGEALAGDGGRLSVYKEAEAGAEFLRVVEYP